MMKIKVLYIVKLSRTFNLIQKRALDLGYTIGEVIPSNFNNQLDAQSNYSR